MAEKGEMSEKEINQLLKKLEKENLPYLKYFSIIIWIGLIFIMIGFIWINIENVMNGNIGKTWDYNLIAMTMILCGIILLIISIIYVEYKERIFKKSKNS